MNGTAVGAVGLIIGLLSACLDFPGPMWFWTHISGHISSMEDLVLLFMTVNVLAFSVVVIYHASHANKLRHFKRSAGRKKMQPAPSEVFTTAEFTDYVRRGLEDLTVMLAQAARKPHD